MTDIVELVDSILNPLQIPVNFMENPDEVKPASFITFFEYNQQAYVRANDEEKKTVHYIQVDFFTRDTTVYTQIVKQIKDLLIANGFIRRNEQDLYDSDLETFQRAMRFSYVQ
ncbi:hypothetical protein ABES25_09960 [Bacillus gobiensis]|uniref:hypothetical protein n=1 Tax=Bacillus gobiensis TaxID=1441095 RepID=UPI003D24F5B4